MSSPEKIKKIIKELIEKLGFQADFISSGARNKVPSEGRVLISFNQDNGNLIINLQLKEASILIGQNGNNLQALQHLARVIVQRRIDEVLPFILDVNNYQRQKIDQLKKIARHSAERAIQDQQAIMLKPMSSFERRIIHLELANKNGLKTESQDQGPERRVVIRPV